MQSTLIISLILFAPGALLLYALLLLSGSSRRGTSNNIGVFTSLFGVIAAVAGFVSIYQHGALGSGLLGWQELGFSLRVDALSMTMLAMISILGFVILKFSSNYMDGDPRKRIFFVRLATTIASVELLILSGNLFQILIFWMITSVCLHYLLVFYRHRPQAIAAARKKFMVARLGDISLVAAFLLLYYSFGTGELSSIFAAMAAGHLWSQSLTLACVLMAFAALLKSAQFPTHGWLIEVVETPTPVSALLHAGLLNAGPFLMVRFSSLMIESISASMLLLIVGGFTALFASVVYLTQPSIKVSLGYSSVAHMGFSLLLCGLGIYSAAILHIVGHSFYKAHSFLSSGSAVEVIKSQKVKLPKRSGNPFMIMLSMIMALVVFMSLAYLWGMQLNDFSLLIVGTIIIMGLTQLLAQTLDAKGNFQSVVQVVVLSLLVALSFFSLEHGSRWLLQAEIPALTLPDIAIRKTAVSMVTGFALVILIQLFSSKLKSSALGYQLGVHLRNGLYANVLFDRIIGSLKPEKFKWANLTVQEEQKERQPAYTDYKTLVKQTQTLVNS